MMNYLGRKILAFVFVLTITLAGVAHADNVEIKLGSGDGFKVQDSNGSALMDILSNGNLGIGNTSPSYKLDVSGDINFTGSLYKNGSIYGGGGGSSAWTTSGSDVYYNSGNVGIGTAAPEELFEIKRSTGVVGEQATLGIVNQRGEIGDYVSLWFKHNQPLPGDIRKAGIIHYKTGDFGYGDLIFVNDPNADVNDATIDDAVMVIKGNGNVGIGTTSPSYKLHVNGTAAGTSWTNLSSREYKDNIKKVDSAKHEEMLTKLMNVDINTYNYKEEYGDDHSEKIGFIAEEMPEEVLSKDGKGVDVYELLTYTIGAMKAQQEEIEQLKARLLKVEDSENAW